MFEKNMFKEDGFKNFVSDGEIKGFQFDFKMQYYRGVSLSIIRNIQVWVDGEEYKREDIRFCIMGSGPALEELKALNKTLGLEKYVEFPGRVSNEYLADVLNTADVCVNPDIPSEMNDKSTMNKIMEYMAFGKPIVQYTLKEGQFSAFHQTKARTFFGLFFS